MQINAEINEIGKRERSLVDKMQKSVQRREKREHK